MLTLIGELVSEFFQSRVSLLLTHRNYAYTESTEEDETLDAKALEQMFSDNYSQVSAQLMREKVPVGLLLTNPVVAEELFFYLIIYSFNNMLKLHTTFAGYSPLLMNGLVQASLDHPSFKNTLPDPTSRITGFLDALSYVIYCKYPDLEDPLLTISAKYQRLSAPSLTVIYLTDPDNIHTFSAEVGSLVEIGNKTIEFYCKLLRDRLCSKGFLEARWNMVRHSLKSEDFFKTLANKIDNLSLVDIPVQIEKRGFLNMKLNSIGSAIDLESNESFEERRTWGIPINFKDKELPLNLSNRPSLTDTNYFTASKTQEDL